MRDAANLPTSVLDALLERKARLEQMTMLCLQRVNMTFVRRWFIRNPGPFERTTEMMMCSSSFPLQKKVTLCQRHLFGNKPWNESTLKTLSSHGSFSRLRIVSMKDLWASYGVMTRKDMALDLYSSTSFTTTRASSSFLRRVLETLRTLRTIVLQSSYGPSWFLDLCSRR